MSITKYDRRVTDRCVTCVLEGVGKNKGSRVAQVVDETNSRRNLTRGQHGQSPTYRRRRRKVDILEGRRCALETHGN